MEICGPTDGMETRARETWEEVAGWCLKIETGSPLTLSYARTLAVNIISGNQISLILSGSWDWCNYLKFRADWAAGWDRKSKRTKNVSLSFSTSACAPHLLLLPSLLFLLLLLLLPLLPPWLYTSCLDSVTNMKGIKDSLFSYWRKNWSSGGKKVSTRLSYALRSHERTCLR